MLSQSFMESEHAHTVHTLNEYRRRWEIAEDAQLSANSYADVVRQILDETLDALRGGSAV